MEELLSLRCTNCEKADADLKCVQCAQAKQEHLFCVRCWEEVHAKQRETKTHTFEEIHVCYNCGPGKRVIATHRCMDCVIRGPHLCQVCSSGHCKAKQFKDHRVVEIDGDEEDEQKSRSDLNQVPPSSSSLSSSSILSSREQGTCEEVTTGLAKAIASDDGHSTSSETHEGQDNIDDAASDHILVNEIEETGPDDHNSNGMPSEVANDGSERTNSGPNDLADDSVVVPTTGQNANDMTVEVEVEAKDEMPGQIADVDVDAFALIAAVLSSSTSEPAGRVPDIASSSTSSSSSNATASAAALSLYDFALSLSSQSVHDTTAAAVTTTSQNQRKKKRMEVDGLGVINDKFVGDLAKRQKVSPSSSSSAPGAGKMSATARSSPSPSTSPLLAVSSPSATTATTAASKSSSSSSSQMAVIRWDPVSGAEDRFTSKEAAARAFKGFMTVEAIDECIEKKTVDYDMCRWRIAERPRPRPLGQGQGQGQYRDPSHRLRRSGVNGTSR